MDIALAGSIDDIRRHVHQRHSPHGSSKPGVPEVELLVGDARQDGNDASLGTQSEDKGQASEDQPADAGR